MSNERDATTSRTSMSDAKLMRAGRALSDAHSVLARCPSCGDGSLEMPDGFRYLVARAFAAGYRLRELGRDGCADWLAQGTVERSIDSDGDSEAGDRNERAMMPCSLTGDRHAYASPGGRLWTCACGARIEGILVALDGQARVATDDQLEELDLAQAIARETS